MDILRNFVVFEGGDGSGTTTQLRLLEKRLGAGRDRRIEFVRESTPGAVNLFSTCEPTEHPIGKIIRQGLRGEIPLTGETIARLFAADRTEHLFGKNGIADRCGRGELVVSDRYVPSSLVYQGITCGEELPALLNRDFPAPELILFFDIDPETAQKRMEGRPEKENYEYLDFQIEVRRRYKAVLPRFEAQGVRVETIDASLPPHEVAAQVWAALQKMPIFKEYAPY
jgi:dTMP kinase